MTWNCDHSEYQLDWHLLRYWSRVSTNGDYILIMWARSRCNQLQCPSAWIFWYYTRPMSKDDSSFSPCQEKRNSNMHPDKCRICTGGKAHVKRSIRAAGPSNFGDDMCIVTHLLLDIFTKKRSLIWPPRAALLFTTFKLTTGWSGQDHYPLKYTGSIILRKKADLDLIWDSKGGKRINLQKSFIRRIHLLPYHQDRQGRSSCWPAVGMPEILVHSFSLCSLFQSLFIPALLSSHLSPSACSSRSYFIIFPFRFVTCCSKDDFSDIYCVSSFQDLHWHLTSHLYGIVKRTWHNRSLLNVAALSLLEKYQLLRCIHVEALLFEVLSVR